MIVSVGATTSALLALLGLALLVMLIGRRVVPKPAAAPVSPGAALAPSYQALSPWEY